MNRIRKKYIAKPRTRLKIQARKNDGRGFENKLSATVKMK